MGVYDSIKKPGGDGATSASKNHSLGVKIAQFMVRRGRFYDDQGRENTVKDGELEMSMSAAQTIQTTTDKTGMDTYQAADDMSGNRRRPPQSDRFLHPNNF